MEPMGKVHADERGTFRLYRRCAPQEGTCPCHDVAKVSPYCGLCRLGDFPSRGPVDVETFDGRHILMEAAEKAPAAPQPIRAETAAEARSAQLLMSAGSYLNNSGHCAWKRFCAAGCKKILHVHGSIGSEIQKVVADSRFGLSGLKDETASRSTLPLPWTYNGACIRSLSIVTGILP